MLSQLVAFLRYVSHIFESLEGTREEWKNHVVLGNILEILMEISSGRKRSVNLNHDSIKKRGDVKHTAATRIKQT